MKKKIEEALNEQINKEFFSAYLYLSMSAYLEGESLPGAARWMEIQAKEEAEHAMKIYAHILARGGRVYLKSLDGPGQTWKSPLSAFEDALKHEIFITESIHNLVTLATEEKDYATLNMLQWFVSEQVEEEANARENVEMLKGVENHPQGALVADRALAQRQ